MACASRRRCCLWSCGTLGLVFLVTGCVLIKVFDEVIHDKIDDSLPIKEGSTSYKNWISPPAPIYFQIWVQNVTNYEEVIQTGAKPVLVEAGPYTYREKRKKVNISFEGDDQVTYRENRWFYFDREKSVGPETDTFFTVNLPMLTFANLIRFESAAVKFAVNLVLEFVGEHIFVNLSVADLMWGYEDPLLKTFKDTLQNFGIKFPIDDKFGLFYKQNGTDDGLYTIKTGGGGTIDDFAEVVSWNGNSSLHFWTSDIANSLNGSDGTLYPPFVDRSKMYYLFSSDLCRSLAIEFVSSYGLKGIDLDRFVVPPDSFANVSVNPSNLGFCTPQTNCLPAGLLNASVCREGAPVIFSLPHFLYGDPDVIDRVEGMTPNEKEHQSVIDIEPLTGVVMNAAKRLQINAYLTNISGISDLANFKDYVILPILWLNESATIDDKSASDFKHEVLMMLKLTEAVKYGLIALGSFVFLCVVIIVMKALFFPSKDHELQPIGDRSPILPSA